MEFSAHRKSELLIALADCSLQFMDIDTKQLLCTFKYHTQPVTSLHFCASSAYALSCAKDSVVIWDLAKLKKHKTLASKHAAISHAKFAPKKGLVITCLKNEIYIWNGFTFALVHKIVAEEELCDFQRLEIAQDEESLLVLTYVLFLIDVLLC